MKLMACWELQTRITAAADELQTLRELVTSLASGFDGMPRPKNHTSRVERLAAKIVDTERRLEELREELTETQADLSLEILSRTTGRARDVLILRYVACKQFRAIADELHLSERTTFRLHRLGKQNFGE